MVEPGFVKADSTNLPVVDIFMVAEYIKNDDRYNAAEIRLVKASLSSRENYGDSAIGYVSLRTESFICTIKGKMCPEHRVRKKNYNVKVIVDVSNETIQNAFCEDCAASKGGCKHALAFLMWLHRKSENRSPTEVECYCSKPILSSVGTTKKYVTVEELSNKGIAAPRSLINNSTFLSTLIEKSKQKNIDSQITRHNFMVPERMTYLLSMHQLLIKFLESNGTSASATYFLQFSTSQMSEEICQKIEEQTREQSDNFLWHELRYGRVTASILHEVAHCKTSDGNLILRMLGASKKFDSSAMKRGRQLEELVVTTVEKQLNKKLIKSGLILIPKFPILGASPDALGEDFVVEIKCPSTAKSISYFIKDGKITEKCKAQVHLQMFASNKRKALFCVADHEFEQNNKVTILWIDFDRVYVNKLIAKATRFWRHNVYQKMKDSIKL